MLHTTGRRLLCAVGLALVALAPRPTLASYYDLIPSSTTPLEAVTYDARYPYWTQQIYIATYPHHAWSREGWTSEYYGGVQLNSAAKSTFLLWSTWQVRGKDAPASGIDFVHAGPRLGWRRSTWEGSSGGVSGSWPPDEFRTNQWYRFVHRTWRPIGDLAHLGYAGVWMKALETGQWYHMATFKFPAELTGFNNMFGFMEWFGPNAPDRAAAEFRNVYSLTDGKWTSRTAFSARNAGGNAVTLTSGEGGVGVLMETVSNPIDPATGKRPTVPVVRQELTLRQPEQPEFFDQAKVGTLAAEWLGRQLVARWTVDTKSSPQLGYDLEVYDGERRLLATRANEPEARECTALLPELPRAAVSVRLRLRDILGQTSPEARCVAAAAKPLAAAATARLAPRLAYRYYESPQGETWSNLPDFAARRPVRSGITATPDITPRLRRNGYALAFDGYLRVPADGLYTFALTVASGARLTLDGRTVVDADGDRSIAAYPGTVALRAGLHALALSFYHGRGRPNQADDYLQLSWAGPGFDLTPVPASAFSHAVAAGEQTLTAAARPLDAVRITLSSRLAGGGPRPKRTEYYAVNDQFDYFAMQGGRSAGYFLAATDQPDQAVIVPIWGGRQRTVFARAVLDDGRTVDSAPVEVTALAAPPALDANGMRLTALEHHLYPMASGVDNGTVTLVGESMGLLTRPHRGDVTITAHLTGITSNQPLADGTTLDSPGNWYSGLILRNSAAPRPGEPLGGAEIPYIALFGSADGATRRCDSTMINGAGNQPSGDIGRDAKWFRLTRQGQDLAAYLSRDGQTWSKVAGITQPKLGEEIEVGFVHYALPCATPVVHWASFDHVQALDRVE
ncbi:MAG: DUF3472 domain-containing protein [Armatimonadetes bacterium]|nr:DUF3472 domain-containing protein [Armatimonadota bacterium]